MALLLARIVGPATASAQLDSRNSGSQPDQPQKTLHSLLRNKQRALQLQLGSLVNEPEQLHSRLMLVPPSPLPNALFRAIRDSRGGVALIAEVGRISPSESSQSLASRCKQCFGRNSEIDAVAVRTDEDMSPDGLEDLIAVSAALRVPVIRTDWILHPVQIAEAREAGAAGVTTVHAVLQKGLPGILKYAMSLGLDPIVEVINLQELDAVSKLGISLCGINLSVKLSLAVPGLRQEIAKSLLRELPAGVQSIVGIMSLEEALEMKTAGASAIYVKQETWQHGASGLDEAFFERLHSVLNN